MADTTRAVLLDLDGTLVDSVYHQVLAWHAALLRHGREAAPARIHAGVGMGGDRLVPWTLGDPEVDVGPISETHLEELRARADTLRPTVGARALLADLARREVPHAVATSADGDERALLLDALGVDVDVVDSGDVTQSKPAPDLLLHACAHLGVAPQDAVMVGDSPWDAYAAGRAPMPAILLRCGGFSEEVLRAAGPVRIVDDPRELVGQL